MSKAIQPETRAAIKAFLEYFIEQVVQKYRNRRVPDVSKPREYLSQSSRAGQLKPFHSAIIPPEILRINEFERGFSTSLGSTFEECARLIGKQYCDSASRSHDLSGTVSAAALQEIERQVRQFEHAAESGATRPSMESMVKACLAARRTDDLVPLRIRADLYLGRANGEELFFEIKSPQPNKGQCLEVTQRLLRVYLLNARKRSQTKALFAMAYNPYGPTRSEYKWSFATNYTPFEEMIVIGNEFWTLVGGKTAFEELLDIYQEVGRDKTKHMLDSLAFGF